MAAVKTSKQSAASADRGEWRDMPAAERIQRANNLIVLHPRFRDAVELLRRCHESARTASEPACGALLGASGVGKTSVISHYHKLHPAAETETATCQPVLRVTLQPDARPKGIAADLLLALGDPAWSSGTVQTLTNRAVKLLQRCRVELIVFDEFHHLFDMDRAKVMTKAAQWLKVLIVNTSIPIVVCGMPEAEHVLRAEHTERRFKERLRLHCFTWRTPAGRREFCGMLKRLDQTLPLAEESQLADPDLAGRFYLACRGVPDYLMTLVRGGVAEALGRRSERIELPDLARVFEAKLAQQRVLAEQPNPFIGQLDRGALDRVQPADQARTAGVGLSPKASGKRPRAATASDYLGGR
ncbi:TniB family NTP-binding protein [Lignipirellula cremea]|uniref:Bacterial TniB protein n=1 Tax=Lignipirellula cremea TaxID=2528010 RepID=A0A518DKH3_9BACT|nr:TniB family NTP-binding protein [Lignipirellula cremea]QDU92329.1 Bacterial TniB protein [Lignipirellula cremea]